MRSLNRTTRADLRDASAIGVAIALAGASYGAVATAAGQDPLMTVAISALVYAGGAQLIVLGVLTAGGSVVAAVVGGLLVNLRTVPYALALAPHVGGRWSRLVAAFGVVDGAVPFTLSRAPAGPRRARRAFWIVAVAHYVPWQLGTVAGVLLGSAVPDPDAFGVDAALPAALLALLAPVLRDRPSCRVGLGAAAVSLATVPVLPPGLAVLAGLLGVGLAGRSTATTGPPAMARPEAKAGGIRHADGPPCRRSTGTDPTGPDTA